MAANTFRDLSLQARDWKTIFGIIHGSPEVDLENLEKSFFDYQQANGQVGGNTAAILPIKDKSVNKIITHLYGATVRYLYSDIGGGTPISRIMTAFRALAVTASGLGDNYLATKIAEQDVYNGIAMDTIKNNGDNYTKIREDISDL